VTKERHTSATAAHRDVASTMTVTQVQSNLNHVEREDEKKMTGRREYRWQRNGEPTKKLVVKRSRLSAFNLRKIVPRQRT
jgi:hypothetical protein